MVEADGPPEKCAKNIVTTLDNILNQYYFPWEDFVIVSEVMKIAISVNHIKAIFILFTFIFLNIFFVLCTDEERYI